MPKAYFAIDTTGVNATNIVSLVNYSKPGYEYHWYVNDALVSTSYNAFYHHDIYSGEDSIKLIVTSGVRNDTNIKYQIFTPAIRPTPPTITSFAPATGYTGSTVTITGTNFSNVTTVSFGGTAAKSFSATSSTILKAIVGSGTSGVVSVTNKDGTASMAGFTFTPPPTITSFNPVSGQAGEVITLIGSNFTGTTSVSFGGFGASSFSVVSPDTIRAVLGQGATGNIVINGPYGSALIGGFVYNYPPVIASVSPDYGGKNAVITLTGSHFSNATSVTFGGTPAASFNINSDTQITAIAGSGETGYVSITTAYGTAKYGFTFKYPPTITSFSPSSAGNGLVVTIDGSGFETTGTTVAFGGVSASSVNIISPFQLTTVVNSGATGNISVTTPYGTASEPGFTWVPAPVINSFTPATGIAGTTVTIAGSNFNNVSEVAFGGKDASSFTIESSTKIIAIVGLGASGKITVTSPGGTGSADGFTFVASQPPTITSFTPSSGPPGTQIVISGTNFNPDPARNTVNFGEVKGSVTAASDNSLTVTVPAAASYQPLSVTSNLLTAYANKPFIVTFGGIDHFSAESYAPKVDFPLNGASATHVISTDLDGDGKPDIIIDASNGLLIYWNTGDSNTISFSPVYYPVLGAKAVFNITSGDLDGDGKPDIAYSLYNGAYTDSVIVLRNTSSPGNISFSSKGFPTSSEPYGLAIRDLNGDGKPDLAVTCYLASQVCVYKNITSGSDINFAPAIIYSIPGGPQAVSLGDIDGDGKPDIIAGAFSLSYGQPSIYVLRNTSDTSISFGNPAIFNCGNAVSSVYTADIDGDGKLDIVTSTANGSSILRNTSSAGAISFADRYNVSTSNQLSYGAVISDFDGDGMPDLAVNEFWFIDSVAILKNISSPGTIAFDKNVDYSTGDLPYGLSAGDFDGDGKQDLAVINAPSYPGQSSLSVLRNLVSPVIKFCTGGKYTIASDIDGTNYQWQENSGNGFVDIHDNATFLGSEISKLTFSNIPISWTGRSYRCKVDGTLFSTVVSISVSDSTLPKVEITTSDTAACSSIPVTFSAIAVNGGENPKFQWMINGNPVGNGKETYTTDSLRDGDRVSLNMFSDAACASPVSVSSNIIPMTIIPLKIPSVSVNASAMIICAGTPITFTATPTNGGMLPYYQWKKNGINTGDDSIEYTTGSLTNGDVITVHLTSNGACVSPDTAVSNAVTVVVNNVLFSGIAISGNTLVDEGSSTSLSSTVTSGGIFPILPMAG